MKSIFKPSMKVLFTRIPITTISLLLLSCILVFVSCSKSADPDPRSQWLGEWNGTNTYLDSYYACGSTTIPNKQSPLTIIITTSTLNKNTIQIAFPNFQTTATVSEATAIIAAASYNGHPVSFPNPIVLSNRILPMYFITWNGSCNGRDLYTPNNSNMTKK